MIEPAKSPDVLSVADLDRRLRRAVENLGSTWVSGEVSAPKVAPSGHLYFTLKDEREDAIIECVMYRAAAMRTNARCLTPGARVHVRGLATFWAPRGRIQLVCDGARPAGKGALLEALDALKTKLAAEGLFASERKRPLPKRPRLVGVVTSASGAAIHDIAKVAFRRGAVRILLSPAIVQGEMAPAQIIRAIDRLERVRGLDVIIVGRGGGAAEDLAAFDDENVVRRLARCRVPVVSAVGHETDVTLVDLVSDVRAATPSHAAELVVPDEEATRRVLEDARGRLFRAMRARVAEDRLVLERLARRALDARGFVDERRQRVDDFAARIGVAMRRRLTQRKTNLSKLGDRLAARRPEVVVAAARGQVRALAERLRASIRRRVARARGDEERLAARLSALSPLAVLARGYAIALRADGSALRRGDDARVGEIVRLRLAEGTATARITDPEKDLP